MPNNEESFNDAPSEETQTAACAVLGVASDADDQAIRQAYLEQVRLHPPDKQPEQFERIRDAYEILRDEQTRAARILWAADPVEALTHFADHRKRVRHFAGPKLWIEAMRAALVEKTAGKPRKERSS